MYCAATKAVWTWYTQQVKEVTQASDGLKHMLRSARGGWQEQLRSIINVLTDADLLAECGLSPFNAIAANADSHAGEAIFGPGHRLRSQ